MLWRFLLKTQRNAPRKRIPRVPPPCVIANNNNNGNNHHRMTHDYCYHFLSLSQTARQFTTTLKNNNDNEFQNYIVHCHGESSYGSREYILIPPEITIPTTTNNNNENDDVMENKKFIDSIKVASLYAHRNIIFGANVNKKSKIIIENNNSNLDIFICLPLVDAALQDCSQNGEQPQGIASLAGLSNWVKQCLNDNNTLVESKVLQELNSKNDYYENPEYQAVKAIATGIPRPGHSVVGMGTFRDGEMLWKKLAKEFISLKLAPECNLYESLKQHNGQLVAIEHLADKNPNYIQTAGGAMARYFFM